MTGHLGKRPGAAERGRECQQAHAGNRTLHRFCSPVKRGFLGGQILEDVLCPMDLSPYAGFCLLFSREKSRSALRPKTETARRCGNRQTKVLRAPPEREKSFSNGISPISYLPTSI